MDLATILNKTAYSVSELLQLGPWSRTMVYEEIKAGRLRSTKLGRRTIFLADDVITWLEKLRRLHPTTPVEHDTKAL